MSKLELPPEIRALFAAATQRRQRRPATCPRCGRAFAAWGIQRYCSPACRQAAYYRRKRQHGQPG